MGRTWLRTIAFVTAACATVSAGGADARQGIVTPMACIDVHQTGGVVEFEAYTRLGVEPGRLRKLPMFSLGVMQLRDKRRMWQIWVQRDAGAEVTRVRYGVLPAGYTQLFPESGSPPVLERGERYSVSALSPRLGLTEFVYGEPMSTVPCEFKEQL